MASEMRASRSTPWLAVVIGLAAGCGSGHNGQADDAPGGGGDDGGSDGSGSGSDAGMSGPPVLGAQLDRMGRGAVSTVLIAPFMADGAARTAIKDAYNQSASPATWQTTVLQTGLSIESEMVANMAVFDAIDVLSGAVPQPRGCGNVVRYAGPAGPGSYKTVADMFADDQLYVDTSLPTCEVYLALEIEFSGKAAHVTCGGRMPSHDALDVTYSVLAAGVDGLDPSVGPFAPRFAGNLTPHSDVNERVFPFLGAPH